MAGGGGVGSPPDPDVLGGACDHLDGGVLVTAAREIQGKADQNRLFDSDATGALRRSAVR
jgi:hypothetical protein